jgi:hypothetical protein
MSDGAVCAIRRLLSGESDTVSAVIAIAGNLQDLGGSMFEYKVERLKTSDSHSDSQKEGLRLVLEGGKHPLDGKVKERVKQSAIVEFICDKDKEGTEGEWDSEDKYEKNTKLRRAEDEADDDSGESAIEHQLRKDNAALIWESYGTEKDGQVLRLTWHTKYACEKRDGKDEGGNENTSESWGFFTWFVIMYVSCTRSRALFFHRANTSLQRFPGHRSLPDLRLVAQLQPLRRKRMGSPAPRRHHPRHPLSPEGLDA